MYTFSIIIPHKNSSRLLERLLTSIPQDDMIQVIVVDDHSIVSESTCLNELQKKYSFELYVNTNIYAGGARNVGIEHAKGMWILFADSDDFFEPSAFDILKQYVKSNFDIIYFNVTSKFSADLSNGHRDKYIKSILEKCRKNKSLDILRCCYTVPWGKMYKGEFIKCNNLRFEEIIAGNDMMFSVTAGIIAKNITFDFQEIYCVTVTENSITTTLSKDRFEARFQATLRVNDVLRKNNYSKYQISILYFLGKSYQFGIKYLLHCVYECGHHRSNIFKGLEKILFIKQVLMDRQNTNKFIKS